MKIISRAAIGLIRLYQKYLSPLKGRRCCRFYPTCSAYAIEAIREWGIIAGGGLAIWRLLRCNPFCRGGIEYVPERRRKNAVTDKT